MGRSGPPGPTGSKGDPGKSRFDTFCKFGLNGNILVIVEVCFVLMTTRFQEYFQVQVFHP